MKRVVLTSILVGLFQIIFDFVVYGGPEVLAQLDILAQAAFGSFVVAFTLTFFAGLVVKYITRN